MANIAGYPSAVMTGSPGKNGRIQGIEAVPFSPLSISAIKGAQGITPPAEPVSNLADQSVESNDLAQDRDI